MVGQLSAVLADGNESEILWCCQVS